MVGIEKKLIETVRVGVTNLYASVTLQLLFLTVKDGKIKRKTEWSIICET